MGKIGIGKNLSGSALGHSTRIRRPSAVPGLTSPARRCSTSSDHEPASPASTARAPDGCVRPARSSARRRCFRLPAFECDAPG